MPTLLRAHGLREFIRAADMAEKDTKKTVRDRLRKVGEIVRQDAAGRLAVIDPGSAAGLGVTVRRAGLIVVEQRKRRVTGRRPDYGALQMRRALLPAGEAKAGEAEEEMARALDDLAEWF